jgi:hypothetical protein
MGCLPNGKPVEGRLLVPGRNIEKPTFVAIGGEAWVTYEVRTSAPLGGRGATYDLRMVRYEDGEQRTVIENIADRIEWWPQSEPEPDYVRYYMVNETAIAGSGTADTPVATLVRLTLSRGVLEQIEDVSSYQVEGRRFWYRTAKAGQRLPDLHYRFDDGTERLLGPSAGAVQTTAPGRVYFVAGEDQVLSRIKSQEAPVEALRTKVTRFILSREENWMVLQVAGTGRAQTVVRSIDTGDERAIPGANTCCWMSFSDNIFTYSESATAGTRGKLHIYNVVTEDDRTIMLPEGLSDVSRIIERPGTDQALFIDSRGRVALVRSGQESAGQLLNLRPVSLTYTEDGRYLLYIDPQTQQPLEGHLMLQDADFLEPPRQVNERGSLVPDGGYFFIPEGPRRILVFWSHIGRNASDLFFTDHETRDMRKVAQGISEVTVTARRVVGIVRVSGQDLVGDLVNKDLLRDEEIILGHEVADAAVWSPRVAFVVRERVPAAQDGLWATGIDGFAGGTHLTP